MVSFFKPVPNKNPTKRAFRLNPPTLLFSEEILLFLLPGLTILITFLYIVRRTTSVLSHFVSIQAIIL